MPVPSTTGARMPAWPVLGPRICNNTARLAFARSQPALILAHDLTGPVPLFHCQSLIKWQLHMSITSPSALLN
jgi:hypothetical protein